MQLFYFLALDNVMYAVDKFVFVVVSIFFFTRIVKIYVIFFSVFISSSVYQADFIHVFILFAVGLARSVFFFVIKCKNKLAKCYFPTSEYFAVGNFHVLEFQ